MASGNWEDILELYRKNQFGNLKDNCFWMEKLITHLTDNRQLSDIYPLTSHLVLSLTICESYSEVRAKPHLQIKINSDSSEDTKDRYKYDFTIVNHKDDGEIYRISKDSIFCSFERSLEVFDEMIEKLKQIS